jgi:replicative superfamily II helicase
MPPVIKITDKNELVPTSSYPYAKFLFENFNPVQSSIYEYHDKEVNVIIASSTSSGKTAIAEMFLSYEIRKKGGKGLYLAPMRSLAQEKLDEWTTPPHHFSDLNICICTGDYRLTEARRSELENADLIIMTNEMLSHQARSIATEKIEFLSKIKVLVGDEVHLLGTPSRGDHAEVGLMKITESNPDIKLILLSATVPNVEEIADWVSYTLTQKNTVLLKSKYRPCPLITHYEKYDDSSRKYEENELNKVMAAMDIVDEYPKDKFLIFAHTKKTGELMKKHLINDGIKCDFHSADLDKDGRLKAEKQFREDKNSRVLVATSTLAWGCYKHGTLIQMADGVLSKIEYILPGDKVLSFNGKSFEPKNVLRVGEKTDKYAYRITLSSGEICEVNKDHIFYAAVKRNFPNWCSVTNIGVGDFLAVPKKYNFTNTEEFSDIGYILGFAAGDGCLSLCGKYANHENKYVLDICAGDEDKNHLILVKNMLEAITAYPVPNLRKDTNGVWHIQCKAKVITDKFIGNISIGRDKENLSVPSWIQSDRIVLKSYISGLFDSDGGFVDHSNDNFSLEFSTISKTLATQIQQLLLSFGVRSTVGKKRMKDVIINGRLQIAKREWVRRVRVYNSQAKNFEKNIGFNLKRKQNQLESVMPRNSSNHNTKILFPIRRLIIEHALANNISVTNMCNSIGNRAWNIINKKELSYNTVKRLLDKFPNKSKLNELFEAELLWSKVLKIELVRGGTFQEIEIDDTHNFIGAGIVSHNCNFPARRVIILGVHRGLDEVATYDVAQEIGRAGRPQYDPAGDAYILLPEKNFDLYKLKFQKLEPIQSRMLEEKGGKHKVLAFHIVSEIYQGHIKTKEDVHHWYKRSLAHFQSQELDDDVVDKTIDSLKKCGAVWEEDNILTATNIGKIASLFYYSPYDVSDLKKNFTYLFNEKKENSDLYLSVALGNLDSLKFGIVSKADREEMSMFQAQINQIFGRGNVWEPAVKASFIYYQLLNGNVSPTFISLSRGFQHDFPRMNQVLKSIDSFSAKWDRFKWFKELQLRVSYGVKGELVYLCQLPAIGKVRATKLWNAGLKSIQDVANNPAEVRKCLGLKPDKIEAILAEAKKLAMIGDD